MATPADTIRNAYEAFAAGDVETVMGLFSNDVVWEQGGNNALTGTYKGRDGIMEMLAKLVQLTEATIQVDLLDVFADDRRAVVLAREQGQRPDGRRLDCRELHLWDFDTDGAIIGFSELNNDEAEHDTFWT
jgi:uncharacterized protein